MKKSGSMKTKIYSTAEALWGALTGKPQCTWPLQVIMWKDSSPTWVYLIFPLMDLRATDLLCLFDLKEKRNAGHFQHQLFRQIIIPPISFHRQNTPYSPSWLHAASKQWIMRQKTMDKDLRERRSMTPSNTHSQGWREEPQNGTHRHDCLRQYRSLMR